MPVSGVSSSSINYPAVPPSSGTTAYSYVLLETLANIAGTLITKAMGDSGDTSKVK